MKRILYFAAILVALPFQSISQTPQTFSYQAVARDSDGTLISNRVLVVRIGIQQNDNLIWQEDHEVQTNEMGFFTVAIGHEEATNKIGSVGTFQDIPWADGNLQLQVSIDAGFGLVLLGTSEFRAVPYAIYAADGPGGTGPQGPPGPEGPPGADEQTLSLEGNTLTISGGNSVVLPSSGGSGGSGDWVLVQDTMSTLSHVGIGTSNPNRSTLAVQGLSIHPETPLFEVRREDGFPVFAVYNDGVKVYVDEENTKGPKGGFAVGGYSRKAKGLEQEYLMVTPDSVRIYVPGDDEAKGPKGGFAVGGYSRKAKGPLQDYLFINPDSTRVYVPNRGNDNPAFEGLQGGFAVTGYSDGAKSPPEYLMGINRGITRFNTADIDRGFAIGAQSQGWGSNYLELTPTNTFLGSDAGMNTEEIDVVDENDWGLSSMNVFVGYQAGMENVYGHHNTFLGFCAGTKTVGEFGEPESAAHNAFIGTQSGFNNVNGSYNAYLGCYTGFNNIDGVQNVFIGGNAGFSTTGASFSTMVGNNAGASYEGDGDVTFLGFYAGSSTTGSFNTYLGRYAGTYSGEGTENVSIGDRAGQYNTGDRNVIIGSDAGRGVFNNSSFVDNTLIGNLAGSSLTTGEHNTFIGSNAGSSQTTANGNTFIGYNSGASYTEGFSNTFVGAQSGTSTTTGRMNTMLGNFVGLENQTGTANTYLGHSAGRNNTSGNLNVMIGYHAGYNETGSEKLYIANSDTPTPLIYGDFNQEFAEINGDLDVYGVIWSSSDERNKTNIRSLDGTLEKVMRLNAVSFEWAEKNIAEDNAKGPNTIMDRQIGVIAQDVEGVFPDLVKDTRKGDKVVNYSGLVPVLLEAIKEQQGQIEALERRIAELEQ